MSQPVKRNNPSATDQEEFHNKRSTLKGIAKVEEILSSLPPHSPQQDVSLKRKLSPSSSVAVVDVKVDRRVFLNHAELLRKELAEAYVKKALKWIHEKKITRELRIDSTVRIFLTKAEEEYERRLEEDFPHPSYEPYIGSACFSAGFFFRKYQEKTVKNLLVPKA